MRKVTDARELVGYAVIEAFGWGQILFSTDYDAIEEMKVRVLQALEKHEYYIHFSEYGIELVIDKGIYKF